MSEIATTGPLIIFALLSAAAIFIWTTEDTP